MEKKRVFLTVILGITLIFALGFTTCDMEGAAQATANAAVPEFSLQPESNQAIETGMPFNLSATAGSTDGGSISYQWYMLPGEYENANGTPINGAKQREYSNLGIPDEGIYFFYVAATNTNSGASGNKTATVNSRMATIAVYEPGTPMYPVITVQPVGRTSTVGELPLAVEAELPEGAEGDLSYQWFSALTYTNKDGDRIDKTSATCTVDLNAPGTYYFYVAVTNTITKEVEVEVEEEVEVEIDGETTTQTVTKTETQTVTQIKTVTSHPATFKIVADLEANAGISIDPASKYQYVRGFGGMDIPWGNFFNIEMSEYRKMFTDEGLGYNMMRIMIMPGIPIPNSNEVENATLEETMDYYVNGEGNRPNYYEGVKLVNENGGYVLASPWSPPPRWKTNNSKNSHGRLFPVNYPDYAQYLKDFCQHMYDNGAPIYAVSIQNEPNYSGDYDGCEWSGAEMRDFFKRVGHFTDGVKGWGGGKEIPVVLTMNGESANHPNINDAAMDDSVSRAVIDIIGRHTYGNQQYRYAKALDVEPKKEVWMSEKNLNSAAAPAYPNDSTWNYVWQFMNDVDLSIRLNDESAYIWWALKRFYSFIGDGQYTTTEGTVLPRGYGLSHYAKYAKEMWRCAVSIQGVLGDGYTAISASTATSNVNRLSYSQHGYDAKVSAFVSEDGNTFSLVMFTPTTTSGRSGVDLGTIEINMPEGFVPSTATAMRSNASVKAKTEDVLLSADKKKAYIMLPPSNIVSVKFSR